MGWSKFGFYSDKSILDIETSFFADTKISRHLRCCTKEYFSPFSVKDVI